MKRRTLLSAGVLLAAGGCADGGRSGSPATSVPEHSDPEGNPAEASDALVVESAELTRGPDGYPLVRGVVTNVATVPLVEARVRVSIEIGGASIPRALRRDRLGPGESWSWSVLFDDPVLGPGAEISEWQVVTVAKYAD